MSDEPKDVPQPPEVAQHRHDRELAHYEHQLLAKNRERKSLVATLVAVGVSLGAVVGMFYFVVGLCS